MIQPVALDIANAALVRVGHSKMSAWSDSGTMQQAVRDLFATAVDLTVEEHEFFWTEARAQLAEDTVVANLTSYAHAYDLPGDFAGMRTLEPAGSWELSGSHLFTDIDVNNDNNWPKLTYTAGQSTVDGGYPAIVSSARWPRVFVAAVERQLAMLISQEVPAKNKLTPILMSEYGRYLERSISLSEKWRMPEPDPVTPWSED